MAAGAGETFVAVQGQERIAQLTMKTSAGLLPPFFLLMAVLLACVTMEIHPKSRAEVAEICSAGAPARSPMPTPGASDRAASTGQ